MNCANIYFTKNFRSRCSTDTDFPFSFAHALQQTVTKTLTIYCYLQTVLDFTLQQMH